MLLFFVMSKIFFSMEGNMQMVAAKAKIFLFLRSSKTFELFCGLLCLKHKKRDKYLFVDVF